MLAHIEAAFRARMASEEAARRSEEAARRSALDANRSEDRMRQFVADASHELRTPLTAIRGFAEYYRQRGGVGDASQDARDTPADTGDTSQDAGDALRDAAAASPPPATGTGPPANAGAAQTPARGGRPPQGQDGDPAVILEVSDQGAGLTDEQKQHVFERFYRTDRARSRRAGGTGLGLAIVAAMVSAHHGRVWVHSEPGNGATFGFALPLAPEARATAD